MKTRKSNKAKRVDHSCRNNGTCKHCQNSRLYQANREIEKSKYQEIK